MRFPHHCRIAIVVALAVGGLIAAVAGTHPGLTPDSVAYLSAAARPLARWGPVIYTGLPLVDWPPLYPWAIRAATVFGLSPEVAGIVVNAAGVGITSGLV